MDNKMMENWQDYSKSALAAAKELETINTKVIEKLTGKQMDLANTAFEVGTRYMGALTDVNGYQNLMAEQTKLVSEYNEKLIETARSTADIITEAREAYQAWMEKGLQTLTANTDITFPGLKPVPSKTAKKAA